MCSLFGNTFRLKLVSYRETSQIDVRFGSIDCFLYDTTFTEKISEQALICYNLNIENNCKNLFFLLFLWAFFYYLLYVPVDRRTNFGILSKRQNNKVSFTCQLAWVGFNWLHLYLYLFIYVSLEFLLHYITLQTALL